MNERIATLRAASVDGQPRLTAERALLATEAMKLHEGRVSIPVLRALVFQHIMENKRIAIAPGELIVGERGGEPLTTPTYPELCCHSIRDLEIVNSREKISFQVSSDVLEAYRETVIPYWQGKTMREKVFAEMSPQWLACYDAGIFTEFMEQRAPGHTVADGKLYRKGFLNFIEDIEQAEASVNRLEDVEAYDRLEEWKAMKICARAIIRLAERYSLLAAEMAERETDADRKSELAHIAKVTSRVPAHPPENFWEALQMYWFVHIGVITELNTWDSFNPGRLDQHLMPFYKRGLERGDLDREKARELLECFWVKFNNQPAPPKVGVTLLESGTYTDFANINVGGLTTNGSDGVNEVSHLLLEVIDEMAILQPSSNIQLSRKNPDSFLRHACQLIRKGRGQPSVFNADAVVEELLRQGKSIGDARDGGTSGCVEAGAFGKESYILTGYLNLVKILEIALHNGVDPGTGKAIGLQTGDAKDFTTYEQLFEAFQKQLAHFVRIKILGNNIIERLYTLYMPSPFLSMVIDDCISRGKDYNAGGARYNTTYIQGVGIGTITDCLSAIRLHVYDRADIPMNDLMDALSADFEGYPDLHGMLLHETPKYGNDDPYADGIMESVFQSYYQCVNGRKNMKGGTYHIDMLPTTCHVYFGSVTGATPDGRHAGKPLSEGISPVQGMDRNGPTAVIKSASKMDHLRTGGTLLNMKFSPGLFRNDDGIHALGNLIRTYFRLDGHHVQFNIVSRETLLDAQKNPDRHKNLIVRVAGYSDYFSNLGPALQDEIIERSEHEVF
jgi:pyruvate formate-lyase/glycerol dehydratase family glycyl radical enzyme